uniref:Antichymotrypsin-2 n=2 Tax=Cacopsylla melanoneura TaxID=428564 RepID=A0A8D9ACM7_9HEMI
MKGPGSCLVLLCLAGGVWSQCLTDNDVKTASNPMAQHGVYTGQQEFTFDLLSIINKQNKGSNIFLSPFSIYQALLTAYFVSDKNTEANLKQVLRLPANVDKIDTMQVYKMEKYYQTMRGLNSSYGYTFTSANKIFINDQLTVKPCMTDIFQQELQPMSFANGLEAAKVINTWVEVETKNNIKDLISPDQVDSRTNLVLANAAYFKGIWQSKFSPALTKPDVFYSSPNKKSLVKMMKQNGQFRHILSEELRAHILEVPYKGGNISMYFLLPPFASKDGVADILASLKKDPTTFKRFTEEANFLKPVEISIPKFTVTQDLNLIPTLTQMGVTDLFTSAADLSRLSDTPISFGDAVHKARLELDEEGTTAAAATAVFSFRSSRPLEHTKFVANHPFLYFLFDKMSQSILLAGVFNDFIVALRGGKVI